MASTPGFEPGPHYWKASALTSTPSLIKLLGVSLSWLAYKLYNLPNYYGVVVEGIYSSQAQIRKSLAAGFHFTDTSHILPNISLLRP